MVLRFLRSLFFTRVEYLNLNCSVYRGQLYSILIDGVMISVKNEGAHSYDISSFLRILYLQNDLSEPFELEY